MYDWLVSQDAVYDFDILGQIFRLNLILRVDEVFNDSIE